MNEVCLIIWRLLLNKEFFLWMTIYFLWCHVNLNLDFSCSGNGIALKIFFFFSIQYVRVSKKFYDVWIWIIHIKQQNWIYKSFLCDSFNQIISELKVLSGNFRMINTRKREEILFLFLLLISILCLWTTFSNLFFSFLHDCINIFH